MFELGTSVHIWIDEVESLYGPENCTVKGVELREDGVHYILWDNDAEERVVVHERYVFENEIKSVVYAPDIQKHPFVVVVLIESGGTPYSAKIAENNRGAIFRAAVELVLSHADAEGLTYTQVESDLKNSDLSYDLHYGEKFGPLWMLNSIQDNLDEEEDLYWFTWGFEIYEQSGIVK